MGDRKHTAQEITSRQQSQKDPSQPEVISVKWAKRAVAAATLLGYSEALNKLLSITCNSLLVLLVTFMHFVSVRELDIVPVYMKLTTESICIVLRQLAVVMTRILLTILG